jgi:hypothetical protein
MELVECWSRTECLSEFKTSVWKQQQQNKNHKKKNGGGQFVKMSNFCKKFKNFTNTLGEI